MFISFSFLRCICDFYNETHLGELSGVVLLKAWVSAFLGCNYVAKQEISAIVLKVLSVVLVEDHGNNCLENKQFFFFFDWKGKQETARNNSEIQVIFCKEVK